MSSLGWILLPSFTFFKVLLLPFFSVILSSMFYHWSTKNFNLLEHKEEVSESHTLIYNLFCRSKSGRGYCVSTVLVSGWWIVMGMISSTEGETLLESLNTWFGFSAGLFLRFVRLVVQVGPRRQGSVLNGIRSPSRVVRIGFKSIVKRRWNSGVLPTVFWDSLPL